MTAVERGRRERFLEPYEVGRKAHSTIDTLVAGLRQTPEFMVALGEVFFEARLRKPRIQFRLDGFEYNFRYEARKDPYAHVKLSLTIEKYDLGRQRGDGTYHRVARVALDTHFSSLSPTNLYEDGYASYHDERSGFSSNVQSTFDRIPDEFDFSPKP